MEKGKGDLYSVVLEIFRKKDAEKAYRELAAKNITAGTFVGAVSPWLKREGRFKDVEKFVYVFMKLSNGRKVFLKERSAKYLGKVAGREPALLTILSNLEGNTYILVSHYTKIMLGKLKAGNFDEWDLPPEEVIEIVAEEYFNKLLNRLKRKNNIPEEWRSLAIIFVKKLRGETWEKADFLANQLKKDNSDEWKDFIFSIARELDNTFPKFYMWFIDAQQENGEIWRRKERKGLIKRYARRNNYELRRP